MFNQRQGYACKPQCYRAPYNTVKLSAYVQGHFVAEWSSTIKGVNYTNQPTTKRRITEQLSTLKSTCEEVSSKISHSQAPLWGKSFQGSFFLSLPLSLLSSITFILAFCSWSVTWRKFCLVFVFQYPCSYICKQNVDKILKRLQRTYAFVACKGQQNSLFETRLPLYWLVDRPALLCYCLCAFCLTSFLVSRVCGTVLFQWSARQDTC